MSKNNRIYLFVNFFFLLLLAIFFYSYLFRYTLNIPIVDDVEAFNSFLSEFKSNGFWAEFLNFFKPSGDHVILIARILVYFNFLLFRTLDYKNLLLLSNISLFGSVYVFFLIFRKNNLNFKYFTTITILFFNLQSWFSSSFFLLTTFQFPVFYFFLLVNIYLSLVKQSWNFFFLILLINIILTFSHSHGFLVWISMLPIMFFYFSRKRFFVYLLFSWSFIFCYFIFIYQSKQLELPFSFQNFKNFFSGFFSNLGSFFDIIPNNSLNDSARNFFPLITGVFLLMLLLYLIIAEFILKNITSSNRKLRVGLLSGLIFSIFTALIIGITRSWNNPFGYLEFALHYRSNSPFFLSLIFVYILSFENLKLRSIFGFSSFLIVFLVFLISTFNLDLKVREYFLHNMTYGFNQKIHGFGINGPSTEEIAISTKRAIEKSINDKIYQFPEFGILEEINHKSLRNCKRSLDYKFQSQNTGKNLFFKVSNFSYSQKSPEDGMFIILSSGGKQWIFNCNKNIRKSFNFINYKKTDSFTVGFKRDYLVGKKFKVNFVLVENSIVTYFSAKDLELEMGPI